MTINIALIEPEIPQNTGNIARTCAAIGARLHLVKPLGFEIDDRKLKRAGLDYWNELDITYYESLSDFLSKTQGCPMFFFTTKAPRSYCDVSYPDGSFIVFGKETAGLPEKLLEANPEKCVRIPMRENLRSLNLSNSAAIAAYEILRQHNFQGLCSEGEPVSFKW
ncbi:MAG: tRNA (uridine(34)/cytosine(34)/5-carboxymethylaminomethyluridine(34)-2'-O)-methyltransferase TrmL [Ruminococcaceae bacterium]|nr:tRNA (uridine(34)/cytosine(34)/5-carboxymethylaminomethyluridine(34)-2'-O)-methyltransferase TrmL [Oscillospiraceae bacterium]